MPKRNLPIRVKNWHGLLVEDRDCTPPQAVGYLFEFQGNLFSPDGRIEGATAEEAKQHNINLSKAEIEGLDNTCQVGQGSTFYFDKEKGIVSTWVGDVIASGNNVQRTARTVRFTRGAKTLEGKLRECPGIFFKRVS